jgi:anti-sigma factor RsiW
MRIPTPLSISTEVHVASLLDDYAADRLETASSRDLEAHLLVCDACFAAYVALLVRRS